MPPLFRSPAPLRWQSGFCRAWPAAIAFLACFFLFPTAKAADTTTVITEVMYNPAGSGESEWIELTNLMAFDMDLSGWRLTGAVTYTFPEGTRILSGGRLVVAANPAALQSSAGLADVLGPWTGALDNKGETITLRNQIDRIMDEFSYDYAGRFPVAADGGGVSLAKRSPGLPTEEPESWIYSGQIGGTPGEANFLDGQAYGASTTLAGFGDTWNFNQTTGNLGSTWAQTIWAPGTGGWQAGPGAFAFSPGSIPVPVGTTLNDPGTSIGTHYFQRSFEFTGEVSQTALFLTTVLDDGAVVYLNGVEVARLNMPSGAVDGASRATTAVSSTTLSTPLALPTGALVQGQNILSVSVHQPASVIGNGTGLTLAPAADFTLLWDRVNGAFLGAPVPSNLAMSTAGATAFGSSAAGGAYTLAHINDGQYGDANAWRSAGGAGQFIGVKFNGVRNIGRIAWSRDNTGSLGNFATGTYTMQYTTLANPGAATPETEDAATGWRTIGAATYPNNSSTFVSSRRHEITLVPNGGGLLPATGVRIKVSDGAMTMDELEVSGPVQDVAFAAQLVAREVIPAPGTSRIVINEFGGSSDASWRVELRNTGSTAANLGGLILASSNASAGYVLPAQTLAAGAVLVLDEAQLGFRPAQDDRIFLYNAARSALLDAARVRSTVRARQGSRFARPSAATFGGANTFDFQTGIVINEVMYHFPPNPSTGSTPVTDNPEEWIELHNRTAASIDLANWELADAVSFTFPQGAVVPAGGFLVVAKDAPALRTKWPEIAGRILGNFSGSLGNRSERLELNDANGNLADEVRYSTGGAWPSLPDGDGSSLELRNPRADNSKGGAWSASDEASKAGWQTVTYRMVAGQTFGSNLWNEFEFGMLGAGECLIDDVSVVRDPDGARVQLIQGGDFSSLQNKWRMVGNHGASAIEAEPGNAANSVLHVRSTGQFSFNYNHISSTFVQNTPLQGGVLYEVSFRARWMSGTNQLNSRAYVSRLAKTTELAIPLRLGTPGAQNSRYVANLGPTMESLSHQPLVPAPGASVTVRVRAADPDNVASLTLRYAVNGGATFASVAMTSQGEGLYTAEIPGQTAGKIVQFYIDAQDTLGAASQMPAGGAASRALYVVQDGQGTTLPAHEVRIIMLPADSAKLLATANRISDDRIGGTMIYRQEEAFYNAGVCLQGSVAGRVIDGDSYTGYDISMPADHLFRGVHDSVNIDRSGRQPVLRGQDEIYIKHMFQRAGIPCSYDDLCYVIAPTTMHTGTAILQMGGFKKSFVESQFHEEGATFKYDGIYESNGTLDGTPEGLKNPAANGGLLTTDFRNLGDDKEQYRPAWEMRTGSRRDDYRSIIALCKTLALPSPQLAQQIGSVINEDEWLRCAALYSLCGIGDCYFNGGLMHNLQLYLPEDGFPVLALPWDLDFTFALPANSPAITASYNFRKVVNLPSNQRRYFGHLQNLCNTVYRSDYIGPWMSHYGSVVGQNMGAQTAYIDARRASVLSQLPAEVPFAITTNNGPAFSVTTASTVLEGTGWINIREFRRGETGAVLPATWTTTSRWQIAVALEPGSNPVTIQAYDFFGALVGTATINITSTSTTPTPYNFLKISEVHYHPAAPIGAELIASSDKDDFEFIELLNTGTQPLDISGCAFTEGVDFTFPANTVLAPGGAVLVVRHLPAFRARYGPGPVVAGSYGPADSLSNAGELITLIDASGAVIQTFSYDDAFPWPAGTDGEGASLVAIAPHLALDRGNPDGWRASTAAGGNPGGSDATVFTGSATADADSDGLSDFLEYALGTSSTVPNAPDAATSLSPDASGVLFTFTRRPSADDVRYAIETTTDFQTWGPASAQLLRRSLVGGIPTEAYRIVPPASAPRLMVRLRVTKR
ncbi:MAG: exported protein of unknown function [Chthoniobacteraceae bacterium]|nr:exported protein of unknown function [Chthoniobacteraceae bacterium]